MLKDHGLTEHFVRLILDALGCDVPGDDALAIDGDGIVPSAFATSDFATASYAAAGVTVARLLATEMTVAPAVRVDRVLSSAWMAGGGGGRFSPALRPIGWSGSGLPQNPGGLFPTADGRWINLYMTYPHFVAKTIKVLGTGEDRDHIAAVIARYDADEIEEAILAGGGVCAASRSLEEWATHPQGIAVGSEPMIDVEATGRADDDGWRPTPGRPLAGIRVLDCTRVISGPVATRFLAGYGAEVLRIDPPGFEEQGLVDWTAGDLTLGKRCARLDMSSTDGFERFLELLADADVFVHGLRPGALEGLGVTREVVARTRPGIIEVVLDAYGYSGPWAERRGFDGIVETSSGMAVENARWSGADRPAFTALRILDQGTSQVLAACVFRGLDERIRSGHGSRTRCALARTAAALIAAGPEADEAAIEQPVPGPLFDEVFATPAGPARRLRAPLSIEGNPMFWERPAELLGSSSPVWAGLADAGRKRPS